MPIFVNCIIRWHSETDFAHSERVLWISSSRTTVVVIDVQAKNAWLRYRSYDEIEQALDADSARLIDDPFNFLKVPDSTFLKQGKEDWLEHRNTRWTHLKQIVLNEQGGHRSEIFDRGTRAKLIRALMAATGLAKSTILDWLRWYWQRGQMPNALIPFYHRCGGPGKKKRLGKPRLGRQSDWAKSQHQPMGINISISVLRRLQFGYKKYVLGKKLPLKKALQLTCEEYFAIRYEYHDNVEVPILPPKNQLPTPRQFAYWCHERRDIAKAIQVISGERRYNLSHRPKIGDSTQEAFGPCSLVMVDATYAHYVVSSLQPGKILGRVTIYLFICVFSRLIVGVHIGLERPSWAGAIIGIDSLVMDKVELCAKVGLTIDPEEWPSHHLPSIILADGGEFDGYNSDTLVNSLGVGIDIAAPYRADLKGIVEQIINWIKDEVTNHPQSIRRKERGEKEEWYDVCLDLNIYRRIVLRAIRKHNNFRWLDDYPLQKDMIAADVHPIPVELWNFGLTHRAQPRTESQDIVRLNVLPQGEATVTQQGIVFKKLRYTCELAIKENWFVEASLKKRKKKKLDVAYDPRLVDYIYIRDKGKLIAVCTLVPHDETYNGLTWAEVEDYFQQKRQDKEYFMDNEPQREAEYNAHNKHDTNEARQRTEEARQGLSKKDIVEGIPERRERELAHEQKREAWRLGQTRENQPDTSDILLPEDGEMQNGQEYVTSSKDLDMLRKMRKERLNHDE